MPNLYDYINEDDLERKMEKIVLNGRGRIDELCNTCGTLKLIHKPGACTRGTAEEKKKIDDKLPGLKLQLLDVMEDFRMRRGHDIRLEKLLIGITTSMNENNERLVQTMKEKKAETVITKPKNPPIWGEETFERYAEQVRYWNDNSKDTDLNKYHDLLEVLKKKKDLKDYILNTVLDRTNVEG